MNVDFTDKKVLITGVNWGTGLGLAEGFLKANADVTIVALGEDVTEVADQLSNTYGGGFEVLPAISPYWIR
jgi:NAD(P)-dependent dehydrogenase (short-subunit alcohol dehydrogenase family)